MACNGRCMQRYSLFLLAIFSLLPMPAKTSRPLFAGLWVAEFKGTPYLALEIKQKGSLTGAISTGSVNADAEGNVSEVVEPAGQMRRIYDARIDRTGRLVFVTKESGGQETEYQMGLTEDGKASLKIAGMPVNPFPLVKKAR